MSALAVRGVPVSSLVRTFVTVAVILVGIGLASLAWARVAHKFTTAKPVEVPAIHSVTGVVWGDRVFSSRPAIAAWLREHGATYAAWAARYPRLARVVEASR